jgi:methionyl-tRNA synthetase
MPETYFITTPIYYVNDRPHIGHCYTTVVADALARLHRLLGRDVFFLTGTDEHAEKVVTSARAHAMTPIEWADRNAAEFQQAFALMGVEYSDFVRTTEDRHKTKVVEYVRKLIASGDIYLGDYTGWFDPSQEEYLTETVAKESSFGPYTSPVTGRPLEKRTEKNYFFRLSKYQDWLRSHIESSATFVRPDARRNEVLGRLRDGLQDIPISRAVGTGDGIDAEASRWGILMPDDPGHRIYVWIDALFNYLSYVDVPERRKYWPAQLHLLAKDILWFHAVIWPCLLKALGEQPPECVYAHSYYVREGRKMSKSLGNFIDLDVIKAYTTKYSVDAVRWYLLTQGPLGNTDADFSHGKFVEVYNADLANGLGNCASRVSNMIEKYFGGVLPELPSGAAPGVLKPGPSTALYQALAARAAAKVPAAPGTEEREFDFPALCLAKRRAYEECAAAVDVTGALGEAISLVREVDAFISHTAPFTLAKREASDPSVKPALAQILYACAETLRIASMMLSPALHTKCAALWSTWGCTPPPSGVALSELAVFGGKYSLRAGQKITKGEALFMRADAAEAPPA